MSLDISVFVANRVFLLTETEIQITFIHILHLFAVNDYWTTIIY